MTWGVEMVVAAVVLVGGIAVLITGIAGLRARLPRNRFVGVRTPATMRDDDAFALGNQVAAPATIASGAVLALTGATTPLLGSALVLAIGLVGGIGLLLAGGLVGNRAAAALPEPASAGGCGGCAGGCCGALQQQG